ncbi:TonB-dependent receptor domain-containing protein [Rosistilla oblonga]|uniref:TonB-dependent receptor domain-containing protein n=1 Tax=Rosistilla oblonga TaxID=2527990 RepID=UPI003A978353
MLPIRLRKVCVASIALMAGGLLVLLATQSIAQEHSPVVGEAEPIELPNSSGEGVESDRAKQDGTLVQPVSLLQPTPIVLPRASAMPSAAPTPSPQPAPAAASSPSASPVLPSNLFSSSFATQDKVSGAEAFPKATTDLGDLLRESSSALSADVQSRTPIVHDPRIRSSRVGALAASGSHWVPARADLDTVLSKFDSRQIQSTTIIPGPFAARYGPGFQFVDVELLNSPRFADGYQWNGSSDFDFSANGNQWFGQQSLWTGAENWGARVNYGHRTGDDYRSGNGQKIPSGYESRETTLALGRDWEGGHSLELSLLRLDQTDVVFPGYVFDIDYLVTDGYEATHTKTDGSWFDTVTTNTWYNNTRFAGDAQNPAKRQYFPFLDDINYRGFTDVNSMSTGYRQMFEWGGLRDGYQFTLGHDTRVVRQELNEISSGTSLGLPIPFNDRNSPIPDSMIVNPGLFFEYEEAFLDNYRFSAGGRLDYAGAEIVDDAAKLEEVGLGTFPATYAEIMGTDQYDQDFALYSLYASLSRQMNENLTSTISVGYAERAPTLTELYAAQPFMLVLQNGLNNVTGDPLLKKEKMLQMDLALNYRSERVRTGIRGFYAWGFDYITFENTSVTYVPPAGEVGQVSLRYVNTDLATLSGFETYFEANPESVLTPFANMRYVAGRDRTRNGNFATSNGSFGNPSQQVDGAPRGAFSGISGSDAEPLPSISPLETRLGLRLRDPSRDECWTLELSTRVVDNQDRIATSLLETATPGFTTWDIRSTFRPFDSDYLTVVMGMENFTNKQYREHLDFRTQSGIGISQPGANFYVGAGLTY